MTLPLLFTEVDAWLGEERRRCLLPPGRPRSLVCVFHHGVLSGVLFTPDPCGGRGGTVVEVVCRLLPAVLPDQVLVVFVDHGNDSGGRRGAALWAHRWTRRSGRWHVRGIPVGSGADDADPWRPAAGAGGRGPWVDRLSGAMDRADVVPGVIDTRFPDRDFELQLRPDGPLATLEPLSLDN